MENILAPGKPSEKSYDDLVTVMKTFCSPTPLDIIQRYRSYSRFRQNVESVLKLVAELQNLAKDCEFGEALEENLRDKLVCAVNDHVIQNRIFSEEKFTFKSL